MGLLARLTDGFRGSVEAELRSRLGDAEALLVDEIANYFGRESAGKGQVRGNGLLMATASEVGFMMWLPRRELIVQRAAITEVDTARSHLGKTIGRDLLRVAFRHDGGVDRAAWYVRDPEEWLALLGPEAA